MVISDAAGDLFGTTFQGGANGYGTVFEIAKTMPRVGDRVIGIKSLRISIEQMYRPRISVAMLGIRQKIAIGGSRIDASQHRHGTLEDFVMQADPNCGQIRGRRSLRDDGVWWG